MLEPLQPDRFTRESAAHLLNRAGFGGAPAEIDSLFALGLPAAVDSLVDFAKTPDAYPAPAWSVPDPAEIARDQAIRTIADPAKQRLAQQELRQTWRARALELHQWWLERMRATPRPLQEKMTLFWHSLFATSIVKVKNPLLMWRQNQTFRERAAGNWADILQAMAKDPAMLHWLDGNENRKEHPNENFAREVMELFTLGEGHYTEQDIKESARAFAGWRGDHFAAIFYDEPPFRHDNGPKTYLGQSGNFSGDDILRILANEPRSSQYVSERLWRYFASEEPNPAVSDVLASGLRASGLEFRPVLRELFLSRVFYSPEVVRQQVKGPVQWLVGSCKLLGQPLPPAIVSQQLLKQLGQVLFAPPSVKGWDTGVSWISTNTLLTRYNDAALLVQGQPPGQFAFAARKQREILPDVPPPAPLGPVDVRALFTQQDLADPDSILAALQKRLIQGKLPENRLATLRQYLQEKKGSPDEQVRGALRLLMSTPDFQLT